MSYIPKRVARTIIRVLKWLLGDPAYSPPAIGSRWVERHPNPYQRNSCTVMSTREGYVEYAYDQTVGKFSSSIRLFHERHTEVK